MNEDFIEGGVELGIKSLISWIFFCLIAHGIHIFFFFNEKYCNVIFVKMCLVLRTFKGQLWIFDLPDNGFNYHNRKQNMESAVFVVEV